MIIRKIKANYISEHKSKHEVEWYINGKRFRFYPYGSSSIFNSELRINLQFRFIINKHTEWFTI